MSPMFFFPKHIRRFELAFLSIDILDPPSYLPDSWVQDFLKIGDPIEWGSFSFLSTQQRVPSLIYLHKVPNWNHAPFKGEKTMAGCLYWPSEFQNLPFQTLNLGGLGIALKIPLSPLPFKKVIAMAIEIGWFPLQPTGWVVHPGSNTALVSYRERIEIWRANLVSQNSVDGRNPFRTT